MDLTFYITILLLAVLSRAEDRGIQREEENNAGDDQEDKYVYEESFGSPIYGPSNVLRPAGLVGKSAYNAPALPSSYSPYLSGFGNPYAYGLYNRYGAMPYTTPAAFGYGSFLNNPGFASALLPGLGYSGYGSPYFGRYGYPGFGYGYPGYFPGAGYPAASLKRGPSPLVAGPAAAPLAGPVARAASIGPIPGAPGIPAPVTNAIAGLPSPVLPYRAPYRAVQSKDGTVRYVPAGVPNLPVY